MFEYLKITDAQCNLKQSDSLTWLILILTAPNILQQMYTRIRGALLLYDNCVRTDICTGLRLYYWRAAGTSTNLLRKLHCYKVLHSVDRNTVFPLIDEAGV